MNNAVSESTPYEVICVGSGRGFPLIGSTARIVTVGKALQAAGIGFRHLHFGPCPVPVSAPNGKRTGVYQGIPYEYTCSTGPSNALIRWGVYMGALARLTVRLCRLRSLRRHAGVYLYVMDGALCLYLGLLCRALGFPVVQEMCEWYPASSDAIIDPTLKAPSAFTRWLYQKPIFQLATGILVISKLIERRVRERAATANPRLLIHRLTSIVDSHRFVAAASLPEHDAATTPHFVWCGVGYVRDVHFLVRLLALINREGHPCRLRIISANYLVWGPDDIRKYAREQGLTGDEIDFMGRVDDRTLEGCYKSSTALLLPLWDDDKSRTRIPNKLAEYLASGRPVVTCKVGDLCDFLVDGVNAYVAEPGAEREFADRMIAVLRDPGRAGQIGAAGQQCCLAQLDYRAHCDDLAKFFVECIESSPHSAHSRILKQPEIENSGVVKTTILRRHT